jgi:hypothetical protein
LRATVNQVCGASASDRSFDDRWTLCSLQNRLTGAAKDDNDLVVLWHPSSTIAISLSCRAKFFSATATATMQARARSYFLHSRKGPSPVRGFLIGARVIGQNRVNGEIGRRPHSGGGARLLQSSGRKLLITKCDRIGTQHLPSLFRHGAYLLRHDEKSDTAVKVTSSVKPS